FLHALYQAVRAHVGPVSINEVKARSTTVRLVNYGPACRHVNEAWPQRMLAFIVYQDMINAVFVLERIRHLVLHCAGDCANTRCLPSSLVSTLPIISAG